jgi:hypothetical protein
MNTPNFRIKRTPTYLGSLPMYDVQGIKDFRESLKEQYGVTAIRIRGRHDDRKAVLGRKWVAGAQNDIPWKQAQWVAFYKRW